MVQYYPDSSDAHNIITILSYAVYRDIKHCNIYCNLYPILWIDTISPLKIPQYYALSISSRSYCKCPLMLMIFQNDLYSSLFVQSQG